jgi:hypothetical protein
VRTKTVTYTHGEGELKFLGFSGPVTWRLDGEPEKLRMGPARLKGALTTTPDVALEAFRAGEGLLTLEGGARYRVTMVGHSDGEDEVFVEVRV